MKLYKIAKDLGTKLHERQLTIVSAESCTGGWIAQEITSVPGSSKWFSQGWVTYSNESKTSMLDVPAELIVKYGAVSEPVVSAMASGALYKSGADIAVATSGVAGPDGGTEYNPVGTVWTAIAIKQSNNNSIITECLKLDGNRTEIREQSVEFVLQKVLKLLNNV